MVYVTMSGLPIFGSNSELCADYESQLPRLSLQKAQGQGTGTRFMTERLGQPRT